MKKFDGSAGIYDIKPGQDPPPLAFKYVRVPCNDTEPFEEVQGHGYHACDNFLKMLQPKFAGGAVDADKAQRAAVQHLGSGVPTLGEKGLSTLTDAAEDGAVECFALVRPAKSNNHTGVYIYLDEVGMLKGLPPNRFVFLCSCRLSYMLVNEDCDTAGGLDAVRHCVARATLRTYSHAHTHTYSHAHVRAHTHLTHTNTHNFSLVLARSTDEPRGSPRHVGSMMRSFSATCSSAACKCSRLL